MSHIESTSIMGKEIRHHFDEESGDFFFSVIDIIESLGLSKDSRNYWKVLKNRLKKEYNKLVTECNQLKMKANDGKYYLTDTAKTSTVLQIIELISPEKVTTYEEFFNKIEKKNSISNFNFFGEEKISTPYLEDGEIKIDMYKIDDSIFVKSIIAGVDGDNIFVSLNCKTLTIKFNRIRNNQRDEDYKFQELAWGKFGRTISLPFEVDIDRVTTNFNYGVLLIELHIEDKTRTKIIKVK